MKIELYSVKSYSASALKFKLEAALAEQNLPYKVREINSVDEFIKAGLSSIPALRIGKNTIELFQEELQLESTVEKAMDHILSIGNKHILVPVDFSPESIHALRYARMMASHLDLGVTVVHVHEPLYDPITGTAFDEEMKNQSRKRLEEMVVGIGWDQYRVHENVPITTLFETGDIVTRLTHLGEEDKYVFILMSTKAEDTFFKRLTGSISMHVSKKESKPVIILPPDAPVRFPQRIVVGLSEDLMQGNSLEYILSFAASFRIFIDFIMVTDDHPQFKSLRDQLYDKLSASAQELSGFNIRSIPLPDRKIHEALMDYSHDVRADMMVLGTKHRSFIENLVHHSVSKNALREPSLPLMILHAEDQFSLDNHEQ